MTTGKGEKEEKSYNIFLDCRFVRKNISAQRSGIRFEIGRRLEPRLPMRQHGAAWPEDVIIFRVFGGVPNDAHLTKNTSVVCTRTQRRN